MIYRTQQFFLQKSKIKKLKKKHVEQTRKIVFNNIDDTSIHIIFCSKTPYNTCSIKIGQKSIHAINIMKPNLEQLSIHI